MNATRIATRLRTHLGGGDFSDDRSHYNRDMVLGLLSEPGCIFCRQEHKTLKWFFLWYLHEGYSEPENLQRMRRSHGFCFQHTRRLLAEGLPQTIASIYLPLISPGYRGAKTGGEGGHFRATRGEVCARGNVPGLR